MVTAWLGVLVSLAGCFTVLLLASFHWYQSRFRYWSRLGVPSASSSFPLGNLRGVGVTKSINEAIRDVYEEGRGLPYIGVMLMFKPGLVIRDVQLLRKVLVKDFSYFHDHGLYFCEETDPLAGHLFNQKGSNWKRLREQLSPTFTSGKIKLMYPIISKCGDALRDALAACLRNPGGGEVEVKDLMARYSTDVIMSCAFGVQTNTLQHQQEEYRTMGAKVFEPTFELAWRNVVSYIMPQLGAMIKLRVTPKDVTKFFLGCFQETVKYRRDHGVHRKDFLQLLMELMDKGIITDHDVSNADPSVADFKKLTMHEAAAQAFIFFIAGFETSSTTVQFALYELALNPTIQNKVAEEIQDVVADNKGEVLYEALQRMQYLDRVVAETLRKYPPIPLLRVCTKQYTVPDTSVVLEEGTPILVPLLGLHRDPLHFPNPDTFDPDRFTRKEAALRDQFAYMPFGEGPRYCLGSRFGKIVTKLGLVNVLANYRVETSARTPIPMVFDPQCSILTPKEGMHLKMCPRTEISA